MPAKGQKQSKAAKAAASANLKKWADNHAHEPRLTHGAESKTIRRRYSDKRTAEGKRLHEAMELVVADLGGPAALNAAQTLVLSALRSKMICLFQIGLYIDTKSDVIDDATGDLIPCMRKSFLAYTTSVNKDLELLYNFSGQGKRRNIPSLVDLINKDGDT
jgi:hypothetical protein